LLRGWLKPGIFAPLAYAASPINGDAQIFKKHANDLNGKTVIPFTTHEGSGLANCVEDVKDAFPGANVTKGFSIYGHEVRTEKKKVEKWLKEVKSEE
jgi:flavodoxin